MSFRKRKPLRKPILTTHSSSDSSQEDSPSAASSKTLRNPMSHLSFDHQEDVDSLVSSIKIKRNKSAVETKPMSTDSHTHYSKDYLQQLKESTLFSSRQDPKFQNGDIPDDKTIQHLKKLKEQKKSNLSKQVLFIPLEDRPVSESRLIHEDQELEGEEAFEDYGGRTITFGSEAIVKAEQDRKLAMELDLIQTQQESELDSDMEEWEDSRIRQGHIHKTDSLPMTQKTISMDLSIPKSNRELPTFEASFALMENMLHELESTCQEDALQLVQIDLEISQAKSCITTQKQTIQTYSESHNFYQDLKDFVVSFAQFLDEHLEKLSWMENDFVDFLSARMNLLLQDWERTWRESYGCLSLHPIPPLPTSDRTAQDLMNQRYALLDARDHFFDDVEEEYWSLYAILQRFETWKSKFPGDYENCFATLSLPGLFEIHLRLELCVWNPLESETVFESMQWHQTLVNFGEPVLVMKMVTRFVIPKLKILLGSFFEWNHSENVSRLFNCLLDYTEASSPAFKSLLDVLETRMQKLVEDFKTKYPPLDGLQWNGNKDILSHRLVCFETLLDMYTRVIGWKKWISKEKLIPWALVHLLNGYLIPCLEGFPLTVEDFMRLRSLVDPIPEEWIPSGQVPPPLFRSLESLLKSFYQETFQELGNKEKSEFVSWLVKIQSLSLASQVSC